MPASRQLQVRYPGDLAAWFPTPPTLQQLLAPSPTAAARIGLHNDCFLASPDDVGTYWASTPQQSAALRTYAQQASATTGAGIVSSEIGTMELDQVRRGVLKA